MRTELIVIGSLLLVSLVPVVWAMADVIRRPAWQFSPGRKAVWALTLGIGWLLLWPFALLWSVLYLAVVRRRLPPASLGEPGRSDAPGRSPGGGAPYPGSAARASGTHQPVAGAADPASSRLDAAGPLRPATLPPAGWYPDPAGGPDRRWWDGVGWTEHLRPYGQG